MLPGTSARVTGFLEGAGEKGKKVVGRDEAAEEGDDRSLGG